MSQSKPKKNREQNPRQQLADRLHLAAIHLLRRVRRRDTVMAQAPAQLSALSVLVFGGPMTLGQLAAAEQVKPPTMTRIVSGLEKSGLAARVTDPSDARKLQIRATAKGTRLMQKGRMARIEYLAKQLQDLNGTDLAALVRALEVLECVLRDWRDARPQRWRMCLASRIPSLPGEIPYRKNEERT